MVADVLIGFRSVGKKDLYPISSRAASSNFVGRGARRHREA